jgi:hypothetical protein
MIAQMEITALESKCPPVKQVVIILPQNRGLKETARLPSFRFYPAGNH